MLDKSRTQEFDLDLVRQHLQQTAYQGPFVFLDSDTIRDKASRFMESMPRVQPHFAVKANPDPRVLTLLHDLGVRFEIASREELDALLALGVDAAEVFYSNPVKSREYLSYAAEQGVGWYVVDSVEELRKVHQVKPDAQCYLRIYTSNKGSGFELSSKFGAHAEETTAIIQQAVELGADLGGVTFHVGSQCTNLDNWRIGIRAARDVFDEMIAAGLNPRLLDLGGGYPVDLREPAPSIETISEVINQELAVFPEIVQVIAEPGRYMVADAGCYVSQVIGTTQRQGQHWLYLDAGFYSGLIELKDGLEFDISSDRSGDLVPWILAGPTCDSIDVCSGRHPLSQDLQEGDLVYVKHAGAYSIATACKFNGFPLPELVVQ